MDNLDKNKNSWIVNGNLPVSFSIAYSPNLLDPNNKDLLRYNNNERRLLVVDATVYSIYKDKIESYFASNNIKLETCVIEATEDKKNWNNTNVVLKFFEEQNLLRREPVIAMGGGVLLDIVGFSAGVYRRGVPYIKVPTTLLGIVDASIGTKVAVNHFSRRNRIGTYYPPIAAFLDKSFIATQDTRNIINGIAEIFKLAIIKNYDLFSLLENNYEHLIDQKFQDNSVADTVIEQSVSSMLEELEPNLWEKILERSVDYGHSFSPLIEMKNVETLMHGEAVAIDCIFSACLSHLRGHINKIELDRIYKTAKNLNLPTWHVDFSNINMLLLALSDTIRHRNGNQYLPVPSGIGNFAILNNVTESELIKTILIFNDYENSYRNRNN